MARPVVQVQKASACGLAWGLRKGSGTHDLETGRCGPCSKVIVNDRMHGPVLIPNAAVHKEIFKDAMGNGYPTLDVEQESLDSSELEIRSQTLPGQILKLNVIPIKGSFDSRDPAIRRSLDRFAWRFKLPLHGGHMPSRAVDIALLIGAYVHILCSTITCSVNVQTSYDGGPPQSMTGHYNVYHYFLYLLVSRVNELAQNFLLSTGFDSQDNMFHNMIQSIYTGCALLRFEICHFRHSLKEGTLSGYDHLNDGLKSIILNWFDTTNLNLTQYLGRRCGTYPNWRDMVKGSLKDARRKGETISLDFILHQQKHTTVLLSPFVNNFTPWGDANIHMAPSPTISMVEVPLLLEGNQKVMEGKLTHVSNILSDIADDAHETSELLPDFSFIIR